MLFEFHYFTQQVCEIYYEDCQFIFLWYLNSFIVKIDLFSNFRKKNVLYIEKNMLYIFNRLFGIAYDKLETKWYVISIKDLTLYFDHVNKYLTKRDFF